MKSLDSCGGPFTERLNCGALLAIFRTPEALPGRVDGECSPAHAISIVQSHSFNGHNWARDLLSQVRSRLRVFVYHLSTSVIAAAAGPSRCAVWQTVHPLLGAVARPRVWFTRIVTPTTKSTALACRYQLATRKVGLLKIDRIRDSPTPTRAETSHGPLINAINSRTCVFARSTRQHSTAFSTNRAYSRSAIGASNCHPRPPSASHIWNHVFEVPGFAAHVLRNDRRRDQPERRAEGQWDPGENCCRRREVLGG